MSRPVTPTSNYGAASSRPTTPSHRPLPSSSKPTSYIGSPGPAASELEAPSQGGPRPISALSQNGDLNLGNESAVHTESAMNRSQSQMSRGLQSQSGTLKKKASMSRTGSMKRSGSRKSSYAGSVRSLKLGEKEKYGETDESNSIFYCPVPTQGNPTELLANRFQAWRKVLKDLINYFRDLHKSYETRSKTLLSASNVMSNTTIPNNFMSSGGLGDATHILRDFHKQAVTESNKARDLENEVIMQLTGLRSDLQQKIKEIKGLSGDFKNSVGREQENTKRAVKSLQEALGMVDHDAGATSGKGDPFIIKMGVDKQVEKQIEEENYLHRAYLNLEASGRELESIVIGEIQKAYNVLAGIFRREADDSYDFAEKLKEGPLAMSKDFEWDNFVTNNQQMIDPRNPVRQVSHVTYPGKDHPAAIEVRSGMLERKSKYLKNYTPGWYILSPTHLHEYKSADRIATQTPVMSLYLPEQKLGSQSESGSSSHKFMLKGRQSGGSMHRGHSWVFRAETFDTMQAWFGDIKELTEKSGEERNAFVRRQHARSMSGNSFKPGSVHSSEGGMEDDDADKVAFSGEQSVRGNSVAPEEGVPIIAGLGAPGNDVVDDDRSEAGWRPQRPAAAGRFPSDINVSRGLQAPLSPSSGESMNPDRDIIAAAGALPGSGVPFANTNDPHTDLQQPMAAQPAGLATTTNPGPEYTSGQHPNILPSSGAPAVDGESNYGEWMAPMAAGAGVAVVGAGGMAAVHNHDQRDPQQPMDQPIEAVDNSKRQMDAASPVPAYGTSSAPIPAGAVPTPIAIVGADPERSLSRPRGLTESTEKSNAATSMAPTMVSSGLTDGPTISTTTTNTAPTEYSVRPAFQENKTAKSVTTISDLHMPGEFPNNVDEPIRTGLGSHFAATSPYET